jgi:hypothetical protein
MAKFCIEFGSGQLRHFPEGTYSSQMAHPLGAVELDMMELMHRVWSAFVNSGPGKWKMDSDEMTIAHWLQDEPIDYDLVNQTIWETH